MPYTTNERQDLGLGTNRRFLLIFDIKHLISITYIIAGQMTSSAKDLIEKHNFIVVTFQ